MKPAFETTPKVNTEAVLMKEARTSKPLYIPLGDIFANHSFEELKHPVQGEWTFTEMEIEDNTIHMLERIEKNSTGRGMDKDTLVEQFYGVRDEGKEYTFAKGSEISQNGMGETKSHVVLGGRNNICYDRGFFTITKLQDDKLIVANYCYSQKRWLIEPTYVDDTSNFKEFSCTGPGGKIEDLTQTVKDIGNAGTYTRIYCDLKDIINPSNQKDNWFPKLVGYIEERFSNYFKQYNSKHRYDFRFKLQKIVSGNTMHAGKTISVYDVLLKPKDFLIEDKWIKGKIDVGAEGSNKETYDIMIAKRVKDSSPEFKKFKDTKGADRRMLTSDMFRGFENVTLGNKACLIIQDEVSGAVLDVAKVTKPGLERVIMIIESPMEKVQTSADKVRAKLLDADGNPVAARLVTDTAFAFTDQHFKTATLLKEEQVKNQLEQVLKQEITIPYNQHRELYADITGKNIDEIDYDEMGEHYKKHLTNENSIPVHGRLDLSDMTEGNIIEVKLNLPDRDDLNQLATYILCSPKVKRINIVCISDPNGEPGIEDNRLTNSKHGFKSSMVSKFTTEFMQASKVKVEINIIDLRYYGLHKRI